MNAPAPSVMQLVAASPYHLLQVHMDHAHEAVEALPSFWDHALQQRWEPASSTWRTISEAESAADRIKHDIRAHLHDDLYINTDRQGILTQVLLQDKVANQAEDIAGMVLGRKMSIPSELQPKLTHLLRKALATCHAAHQGIDNLTCALDHGMDHVATMELANTVIQRLNGLEHEADQLEVEARSALYQVEATLPPVDVMFLYQLIQGFGHLADHAEATGDSLIMMLCQPN